MHVHDVLIIGAGPAGLAAAARLREQTPSATFTDDEHHRYHWIKKHGRKMNIKNYKTNTNSLPSVLDKCARCTDQPPTGKDANLDMLILDGDGANWMSRWDRLFGTFGIDFLRSPMFFHVDPADRDALLGYTYEEEREKEILSLSGCVGKEVSKHKKKKRMNKKGVFLNNTPVVDERDRKDYFAPSTKLFRSHCQEVARRYGLSDGMIRQENVIDIEYDETRSFCDTEIEDATEDLQSSNQNIFRVSTEETTYFARVVILAVGAGNTPSIPAVLGLPSADPHEGFSHAMRLQRIPPPIVEAKIQAGVPTEMLVVGGGLTSVQIADLALKRGVSKVHLLMRGPVKVKYFDIDLEWVAKFRNYKQAEFWTADDDEERFEIYTQARNGGSMTPRYRKILDAHVASGKISLHTHTTLASVNWDPNLHAWTDIVTSPASSIGKIDYIVFATGVQTDVATIPFLQTIQKQHPIRIVGGLPCLNDDLMWSNDVPLFATGRLAGLRLGPGAPNLVGCRVGAERIAWNVDDVLRRGGRSSWNKRRDSGHGSTDDEDDLMSYASAKGNRFGSLPGIGAD